MATKRNKRNKRRTKRKTRKCNKCPRCGAGKELQEYHNDDGKCHCNQCGFVH